MFHPSGNWTLYASQAWQVFHRAQSSKALIYDILPMDNDPRKNLPKLNHQFETNFSRLLSAYSLYFSLEVCRLQIACGCKDLILSIQASTLVEGNRNIESKLIGHVDLHRVRSQIVSN